MLIFKYCISQVSRGYTDSRRVAAAAVYMSTYSVPGTVFNTLQAFSLDTFWRDPIHPTVNPNLFDNKPY